MNTAGSLFTTDFDLTRLQSWMADHVPDFHGPIAISRFSGGQSNPTYRLTTRDKSYVLRRRPAGPLLKGAHALDREVRVMRALAGTGVPVPQVHALCQDDGVIGSWFYVMAMVEGQIFWDATLPEIAAADRPAYYDAMNGVIARLHAIDPATVGLDDYGRSGNYFQRQIARWSAQYLADEAAGHHPAMDRLIDWLPAHIPNEDAAAIIHGDFRIDNMIFHPDRPEILAVLDWELSTIGHPLADFAYHAMMYVTPPDIVAGLAGADLGRLNIPGEQEYVATYCRRTGRDGIPGYRFYIAFNLFRLAAIFHGIQGRVLRGTAASAQAAERGKAFPRLAELAWTQAQRGME